MIEQALMRVHAGPIVPKKRFGHERGHLSSLASCVLHNVFVDHHIIGGLDHGAVANINFSLTRGRHFMMLFLNWNAGYLKLLESKVAAMTQTAESM